MPHLKIKTGDQVLVLTGKDAGKKGKVTQVFPEKSRVVVEGVNSMTKNIRPRQSRDKGQRVEYHGPIHISNVMLIDPSSGKPTRVGAKIEGDKKSRRAIRSNTAIT